jgi:hypothetical protein
MMMIKRTLLSLSMLSMPFLTLAQAVKPCVENGAYQGYALNLNVESTKNFTNPAKSGSKLIIPVVVHVIHDGIPGVPINDPLIYEDNIPEEDIYRQMEILNQDFLRMNADAASTLSEFTGVASATNIEFVLAQRDPDGNPTNGIDRVFYPGLSHTGLVVNSEIESVIKPQTIWDPKRYFNIWTIRFTESTSAVALLGYAQFPDNQSQSANTDGVVINPIVFGNSPETDYFDNKGRTLTHEVGHWLGLRHIWGDGGCEADDFVVDTPPADGASTGCNVGRVTCENLNMVQNYMDYTNGSCQNLFTKQQVGRINQVMNLSPRRRELPFSDAINPPTGVFNHFEKHLSIFPNPASSKAFVEIESDAYMAMYNTAGVKVQEWSKPNIGLLEINVSQLPEGVYILRQGQAVRQLVVK